MWIKRTQPGNDHIFYSQGSHVRFRWKSSDYFSLRLANGHEFEHQARLFRDPAAWYHLVVAIDTTQGTASNRVKIYWNGEQETDLPDENNPPDQNEQLTLGQFSSVTTQLGWFVEGGYGLDGYIAEVNYIDGIQQAPTEFGEFDEDTAIWKPIKYTGSYGNEGFYLNFDNSGSLGADSSGNGNNFNLNNVSSADQATDTPTNNFAIANPLLTVGGYMKPTEGGTKGVLSTAGPGNNTGGTSLVSTIPVSKGKWYFEAQNTNSGDVYLYLGVGDTGSINLWGIDGVKMTNQTTSTVAWRGGGANDGKVYGRSAGTNYTDTNPVTWETEVVGLALDLDNEKIYFHKSGTWINSGDPANGTDNNGQYDLVTGVDNQWLIAVSAYNLATWHINFGGYTTMTISSAATDANGYGTFEYAPPSGYYALCTKNLAEYG
tara:strand:- start:14 stop:1306 length:1293 start_codon:yes stop_codon:yes gene_type:complete